MRSDIMNCDVTVVMKGMFAWLNDDEWNESSGVVCKVYVWWCDLKLMREGRVMWYGGDDRGKSDCVV